MRYNDLEELRATMLQKQNFYYIALRNYGESAHRYDEQKPEEAHERIERVYQRYLDAKQTYLDALNEYEYTEMTEYTSL